MKQSEQFYQLSPDQILQCAEEEGFEPTGRFLQLNSYENRVYMIFLEDGEAIVGKFYRPQRWDMTALNEEHLFMDQLKAEGLPVVNAYGLKNGDKIGKWGEMFYCFYPRHRGKMPDELLNDDVKKVARTLARLHNVGEQQDFFHRPQLDGQDYGWDDLDILKNWIDPSIEKDYLNLATSIINQYIDISQDFEFQRVHGDCHRGNLLNNGEEFFFVDFDDSLMAPVAQDLWMILMGDEDGSLQNTFLKAYQELRSFDRNQLVLFPYLQAMRVIHYSAWIAKRWKDPSFPQLFPQFRSYNYWAGELDALRSLSLQF
jgi:Ser/Thr protein kinase RdoA (MazF antagonist)